MAAVAVGGVIAKVLGAVGIGVSAASATAVVSAVYVGAAVGALSGAAIAVARGDDILEGALKGAAYGGISGGLLKGAGMALSSATAPAAPGVGPTIANASKDAAASQSIGGAITEATGGGIAETTAGGMGTVIKAPQLALQTAKEAATTSGGGVLTRISDYINKNPESSKIIGSTLGGVAQGAMAGIQQDSNLEAELERAKLNRQPRITDLSQLNLSPEVPSVRGFKSLPRYSVDSETGRIVRAN